MIDILRIFLQVLVAITIVLAVYNHFAFRNNSKLVAEKLGLSENYSRKGVTYEGTYNGRVVELFGSENLLHMGIKLKVSANLPLTMNVLLKSRRYFENILFVEGENISIDRLFEIRGEPQEQLLSFFETQDNLRFKLIECIKSIGSKAEPKIKIKPDFVCLEHNKQNIKSDQMINLFLILILLATTLESQDTQIMEAISE